MQEVIAQVQQLEGLDPAARQQLLEDLKQTDPRLWPDMVRQFRATLAYRQQMQDRQAQRAVAASQPQPSQSAQASVALRPGAQEEITLPLGPSPTAEPGKAKLERGAAGPGSAAGARPGGSAVATGTVPVAGGAAASRVPSNGVATAPAAEKPVPADASARKVDRQVVQTSYEAPASDASRAELEQAIHAMEAKVNSAPQSAGEVAQQAQLRMLYLLAGRRDDAFRPIPSAVPSVQDFWSKELYGLATLLDTQQTDNPERRAAETRQHLSEALDSLSRSSALVVRNLTFVTEVQSYGNYRPFAESKFSPGQEVLVYAEVENFVSEPTATGYATSLSYGYQIFDSRGQRVAQDEFKSNEVCRNQRRDFFIGCHIYMPKRAYNGRHTLQLTVEDLKSQKIGQQTIEFTMVDADK